MQVFNASIYEDVLPEFAVITLIAEDRDSGERGRVVYNISDVVPTPPQLNGTFAINENTGVVRTVGLFDRESFSGPYVVTVSGCIRSYPVNMLIPLSLLRWR